MNTLDNAWLANSARQIRLALDGRPIIIVGLMGSGKSTIGRRLAQVLDLDFVDSDSEIEKASQMTIADLFEVYGEPEFRALEQRVVLRLIEGGSRVVSTGGGAFVNPEIRASVKSNGVSVWLDADIDTLMDRVSRRDTRPLLKNDDPRETMLRLMEVRNPVYAEADLRVRSREERKEVIVGEVIEALLRHLDGDVTSDAVPEAAK